MVFTHCGTIFVNFYYIAIPALVWRNSSMKKLWYQAGQIYLVSPVFHSRPLLWTRSRSVFRQNTNRFFPSLLISTTREMDIKNWKESRQYSLPWDLRASWSVITLFENSSILSALSIVPIRIQGIFKSIFVVYDRSHHQLRVILLEVLVSSNIPDFQYSWSWFILFV